VEVIAHYNLNRRKQKLYGLWTISARKGGKVIAYADSLTLTGCTFFIDWGKFRKVEETGNRQVCGRVRGTWVPPVGFTAARDAKHAATCPIVEGAKVAPVGSTPIHYNPVERGPYFHTRQGIRVDTADAVYFPCGDAGFCNATNPR
jgi:hypothetical protein